jgi:Flp pilus assembly protein TadG
MKHLRAEDGQSLVEVAALIMLLMVMVLGLINTTFILLSYLSVTNAATVGATYAATSLAAANNLNAITNAARSETDSWLRLCGGQPTVDSAHGTDASGGATVSVTVSCDVANLIAIPDSLDHVVASATVVRRVRP